MEQICDERSFHLHCALGAKLLTTEATDALFLIDDRLFLLYHDSLRRANVTADAATDASLFVMLEQIVADGAVLERGEVADELFGVLDLGHGAQGNAGFKNPLLAGDNTDLVFGVAFPLVIVIDHGAHIADTAVAADHDLIHQFRTSSGREEKLHQIVLPDHGFIFFAVGANHLIGERLFGLHRHIEVLFVFQQTAQFCKAYTYYPPTSILCLLYYIDRK